MSSIARLVNHRTWLKTKIDRGLQPLPGSLTDSHKLRARNRIWLVCAVVFAAWVASRLGAFDLWAEVTDLDGVSVHAPVTFASVDHPFHAARAESLRQTVLNGAPLRWFAQHQGGYPAEFYPLGIPWLEVGVWAMLLGSLPMMAIHKLVVIAIFLMPGLAFLLMARRDGWPLDTAVVAFVVHLMVPGAWWQGGYTELVEWGLITNVTASYTVLFVLLLLSGCLATGHLERAAGAALLSAFALVTNPRSLVALSIVGIGTGLSLATSRGGDRPPVSRLAMRLALVAALTAALAAPVLVGVLRFGDLYDFVRYEWYDAPAEYLRASVQALSWPVFLFAISGILAGLVLLSHPLTRAAAATLVLYCATSLAPSFALSTPGLTSNLETPRLMPFQRLLAIYLAAVAFHALATWMVSTLRVPAIPLSEILAAGAIAAMVVLPMGAFAPASPPGEIPSPQRSLYPIVTTAVPEQTAFAEAIRAADRTSAAGTAILVLGSMLSWHQQLWAPFWTDRMLFYDDWLWNWHERHTAPNYDVRRGNAYAPASLRSILSREYLDRHGIGAVVVADTERTAIIRRQAAQSPFLASAWSGPYDVYTVREPRTIVTLGGANTTITDLGNERILASGKSLGTEAIVRRNWFPRWQATVNGRLVPITRTPDGYMRVPLPVGEARLELVYGVDLVDRFARLSSVLAALAIGALLSRHALSWVWLRIGGGRDQQPQILQR